MAQVIDGTFDQSKDVLKKFLGVKCIVDTEENVVRMYKDGFLFGRIVFTKDVGVSARIIKDGKEFELAQYGFNPECEDDDFDEAMMDIGTIIVHLYERSALEAYGLMHYFIGADAKRFGVVRGRGRDWKPELRFMNNKPFQVVLGRRDVPDYVFGFDTLEEAKQFAYASPDHLSVGYVSIYKQNGAELDTLLLANKEKVGQRAYTNFLARYKMRVAKVCEGSVIKLKHYDLYA